MIRHGPMTNRKRHAIFLSTGASPLQLYSLLGGWIEHNTQPTKRRICDAAR